MPRGSVIATKLLFRKAVSVSLKLRTYWLVENIPGSFSIELGVPNVLFYCTLLSLVLRVQRTSPQVWIQPDLLWGEFYRWHW